MADEVTLKVMVDKERNRVLFAEAGNDFVDALFSFLTLPLGTIARLVAAESNIEAMKFGSISSLYQSVADLDQKCIWSETCKDMLLKPRNSMEGYCQQLQLNIDDTHTPVHYYVCEVWKYYCGYCTAGNMSTFRNQKCYCGRPMNVEADGLIDLISVDSGFVRETAPFLIHDDLSVMPNDDLVKSLGLLQMNGINAITNIERKTLLINKMEVVDLLKLSLLSKTPLTDFIFKKKQTHCNQIFQSRIGIGKSLPSEKGKQMLMKLLVRKSTRNILFGIADEDFADFLFSFLTFPLGGVLQMLEGFSSLSCIDILYKSMTELSPERCLRSHELKNKLSQPQIFPTYGVRNQILPIKTAEFNYKSGGKYLKFVDPKSPVSGGYVRGPTTIMVTDELVVTPMSSFDVVSYLERMKVPLNDIEEIVVNIGVKEGLSILKASLTSTSALTNGLKHYLGDEVTLKVMVDKERNKVLYADVEKDFVEVLLSFLTLPLGTISRLVAKESNIEAMKFGSISSLYQSVQDLDGKYLWSQECKEMLLKPRNSMEGSCQKLKLNIDDTPVPYFTCENMCWNSLSFFRKQKCHCGRCCNVEVTCPSSFDNGFVKDTASFIIHDDLSVMPNDLIKVLGLLQMNGINDIADIERKTILISKKEVVDLLKLSLLSKTPLTDFILKKKPTYADEGLPSEEGKPIFQSKIGIGKGLPSEEGKQMLIKLLVRKSTRNILFGIAEEDFADFLFSFLTFPLGGVLQMLEGFSSLSCIDILYKSMTELSPERCLRSDEFKNKLSQPQIFPTYGVRNQILPIKTAVLTSKDLLIKITVVTYVDGGEYLKFVDPKSPVSGGYVTGPTTIMVTDDLVVTPMSSFDGVSYLERMKVPLNDIEEIVVNIGVKEGLNILKASLTSTSALTNGLKHYLDGPISNLKKPKEEKLSLKKPMVL